MLDRPRILLLITKSDVGGAQVHVLEILKSLKHQYEFVLAAGEDDYLTQQARKLQIDVRILKHLKRSINLRMDRLAYRECLALLDDINPDLLHTHSSKAGVIGRLAAWRAGVTSLFTAHGWAFTQGAPLPQRIYGLLIESVLCRLVGSVVTISDYDYQLAARYHVGLASKRYLVKNGVDSALLSAPVHGTRSIQIIAVGRLSPVKNFSMLLSALAALGFPFQAKIVGEGECHDALKNQITRLKLGDRVQLLGEMTEITDILSRADVFVLCSSYEGLPLSILEAMSQGIAVVATDVGGVKEAVLQEKTGLLSARGDVDALVKNIEVLAGDAGLRQQYGEAGRQHYEEKFTAARMIEEMDAVYKKLLSK